MEPAADPAAAAAGDAVKRWLAAHPWPTASDLAAAGYVVPHWPRPWGVDAGEAEQHAIDAELAAAGVELPDNPIGIGWAGPTLLVGGTDEQRARWLPRLLSGEDFWCQLFSEPEAGSDLASLRTTAVRDGDVYVVNGQKVWSTWADRAAFGILLARTDPSAPKHRGISYFVSPMDAPGITVRPIVEMTGGRHFNEVFFDGVRVPVANRIGEEGDGWRLARVTLGSERVALATGGVLWGMGPTTDDFLAGRHSTDPLARQRLARIHTEAALLDRIDPYVKKPLADVHGQRVTNLAKDLRGAAGMLGQAAADLEERDVYDWGFLFSPALTIGGGTAEVQRTIIGEQRLGLPREPQP
jgi:alkylation response protein AidB-like acyl-CoA dehydrogenase